ncbi:cellulose synthase complex periplasmic endoglucanase BcsZ [Acidovorax sp. sic0104]|uniref:cellulose synthase complex periplasmic endoglucanase BcsZ n=1 Tax=Acidovorax sp. sic0104 TaxID=2854784 RepID=UPI001C482CEB|nr:cellulose synthase complex periplasmic endoglucanase BcsZ [Acidovorax sp. sic0104]MBV7543734.1 cellulase [Acidovorax sp. sic0104]
MPPPLHRRKALLIGASALTPALWSPARSQQPAVVPVAPASALPPGGHWPQWDAFKAQFVSSEGRVISDDGEGGRTYSEGQSYGLFFALVANDRKGFDTLLRWTQNNLCGGDLGARLPAWLWGKLPDGSWGVLDSNAASDADIWIAYILGEAARLWKEPRYQALGARLAQRILAEETADIPQLGLTLLPGPRGFAEGDSRWKLNPSYMPLQVMQRLSTLYPQAGWKQLAQSSQKIIVGSAPKGFSPDWTLYDAQQGFLIDAKGKEKGQGGYNAIRVYLWAGMLAPGAPGRKALLVALAPMANHVRAQGQPPESIDVLTGQASGAGPAGFSAALLPFLQAQGDVAALDAQRSRLAATPIRPTAYYEQTLSLFGQGWMDGWYRFSPSGQLDPHKRKAR